MGSDWRSHKKCKDVERYTLIADVRGYISLNLEGQKYV